MKDLSTATQLLCSSAKESAIETLLPALRFLFPVPETEWSRGEFTVNDTKGNSVTLTKGLLKEEVIELFPNEKLEPARYFGGTDMPKESVVFRNKPAVNGQFSLAEICFDAEGRLCRLYFTHNSVEIFDEKYQVQVNQGAAKDFLYRSLGTKPTTETQREVKYELPWGTVVLSNSYLMPTCRVSVIFDKETNLTD